MSNTQQPFVGVASAPLPPPRKDRLTASRGPGEKVLVLLAHPPSVKTQEFVDGLGSEVVTYVYGFNAGEPADFLNALFTTLKKINKEVDMESFNRIILAPPGLSVAASLFMSGLRGCSGKNVDVLFLMEGSSGDYEPVPGLEIITSTMVYGVMRKQRSSITEGGIVSHKKAV